MDISLQISVLWFHHSSYNTKFCCVKDCAAPRNHEFHEMNPYTQFNVP